MHHRKKLKRLSREHYKGYASVHWIHTTEERTTGWLNNSFHNSFREALLHSLSRYDLACPTYCLMPDHIHLLVSGLSIESDQLNFNKRLRQDLEKILTVTKLQYQAFDHVLKDKELERNAFQSTAHYISENPVRKNLSNNSSSYPFSGVIFPGYYGLDLKEENHWGRYWKIYNRIVSR